MRRGIIANMFVIFFLISFVFAPGFDMVVAASSDQNTLNVQYYGEVIKGSLVERYVSINGTNITVSGFAFNLNNTWEIANSTENGTFPAIWVDIPLSIPHQEYWPIPIYEINGELNSRDVYLVFASDYNGTHYREAVIIGVATATQGHNFISEDNKTIISYADCRVIYEENRTVFISQNASSPYSPSLAILNAISFMKNRSWKFDNVTHIFLIPNKYLLDEFKEYEFVWSMIFLHGLKISEKELTELTHFVISPNGTILNYTHAIMRNAILQHPCGDCSSFNGSSSYLIYLYEGIGVIVIGLVLVTVYLKVYKRKETQQ